MTKSKLISVLMVLVFILILIITTETALANENISINSDMDLKGMIDIAIINSKEINLIDEKIVYATQRYQLANAVSMSAQAKNWDTESEHISNKKEEILYPLQKLNIINQLKWEKKNQEEILTTYVTKMYYSLLNIKKQVALQEDTIKRIQKEITIKEKQVNLGSDNIVSLESLEITLLQELQKLEIKRRERLNIEYEINSIIGEDYNYILNIKPIELFVKGYEVNIDDLVKVQLINHHNILKATSELKEVQVEYDIVKNYSHKVGSNGIESIEDRIITLKCNLQDQTKDVELKIRTDYNLLLNLWDDLSIKKSEYEICKKFSETANVKYKLGMVTVQECEKIKANENIALVQFSQAKLDYFIAESNFNSYINN